MMNRPAPISSIKDIAVSVITRVLRVHTAIRLLLAPRDDSLSVPPPALFPAACQAGRMPKANPVSSATPAANPSAAAFKVTLPTSECLLAPRPSAHAKLQRLAAIHSRLRELLDR